MLDFVEDSGAADCVESVLCPPGKGGRPRQIRFSVFLAAVVIAAEEEKSLSLVRVHKVLTNDLARSYQVSLSVISSRRDRTQHVLTIRQVRYMLEALERKLAFTQGRVPDLSDVDRATRESALWNIFDMLTGATIPVHLPAPASYALDGTAIDSWAKPAWSAKVDPGADHGGDAGTEPRSDEPSPDESGARRSFDPDAAKGYRTKTYDNRTNHCFGYHGFGLVGVPPVGADPLSWPKLVERLRLRPANANAVEPAMHMLDSMREVDRPVSELLCDREFSYKKEEDWAAELRRRGIAQVIDMHDGDRGVRIHDGIAMIDGTPHCRAVLGERDHLIRIQRPATLSVGTLKAGADDVERHEHEARVAAIAEFKAQIAERGTAAFRRVAGSDADGNERWERPAQAGKVICANCPVSLDFPKGLPVVEKPHDVPALPEPPVRPSRRASVEEKEAFAKAKAGWDKEGDFLRCCRQRTITLPANVSGKLRQRHVWGSDPWIESYSRRTHIESAFGNLKSDKTTGVKRGWIYVVGIIKTSIMVLAATIANNIRLLRKWADETGDRTHQLTAVDPDHHGFEELDAAGNPDLALAPPDAA